MKLDRIPEYITTFIVMMIGLGLALYVGQLSGAGNYRNVGMIIGVSLVVLIGLTMKQRIWMLMALTMALTGRLMFLPIPFTVRDSAILLAFGWFLVFRAVKMIKKKPEIGYLDVLLFANLALVVLAYCRYPVGVLAMDSDRIGGRPYFTLAVAAMGYWVLSQVTLTSRVVRFLPLMALFGYGISLIFGVVSHYIPASVPILSRIYSGISAHAYLAQDLTTNPSGEVSDRVSLLAGPGKALFVGLCSWFRPITLINPLNLGRMLLLLLAILLIFISGFRSTIASCMATFIAASYYFGRIGDSVKVFIIGLPVIFVLVAGQGTLFDLPQPAQRALSFLPGAWDQATLRDAKSSSEWRFTMWRAMWYGGDRYVKNWWLGDGFGYSATEYSAMLIANDAGVADAGQENFLITGQVHSGPFSTLRYVGYIGLAFYLILAVAMAQYAHRLILRSRGTPFFFASLFFCISIVLHPFFFLFVFGAYDMDMPAAVLNLAWMKLISEGLKTYKAEQAEIAQLDQKVGPSLDLRPQLLTR